MFSNNITEVLVYPVEMNLSTKEKELQELVENNKRRNAGTKIFVVVFALFMVIMGIACGSAAHDTSGYLAVFIMEAAYSVPIIIAIVVNQKRKKKQQVFESEVCESRVPRKEYLETTAARFISGYRDYNDLTNTQDILPTSDIAITDFTTSESTTAKLKAKASNGFLNSSDQANKNIIKKLAAENKMEAIKKYIELYGVSLPEAKEAVDKIVKSVEEEKKNSTNTNNDENTAEETNIIAKNAQLNSFNLTSQQILDIENYIKSGQKIAAIKAVQEATGLGLKWAKDIVDNYQL